MPSRIEALGILLLLLPGFVCAFLVQVIALRAKQTEFDKVVEALLFSCPGILLTKEAGIVSISFLDPIIALPPEASV